MKNIGKIIRISRPLYKILALISFLILISVSLDLVTPILSKYVIDEIVANLQGEGGDLNTLYWLIAAGFAVNMVSSLITSISDRLGDHFAGELRKYLTEKYYNKVLVLAQSYFDTELSGKIVNQLNRGIMTIQGFSNTATNFMLPTILQSIFTIIVMAYYNVPTAIFTFLLFPIYLYITHKSTKKWGEEEIKKNKLEDITRGRIQEVISNIKVVKSFNNEDAEEKFVAEKQSGINKIYARQSGTFHKFDFLRKTSLNLVLLAINLIVFYNAFIGNLTLGEMTLLIQLVLQARRPLFAMSFILTQLQNAESGSKEFFEVLELEKIEKHVKQEDIEVISNPTIEFKNVDFHYETSEQVLKKVSFKLSENEKVALVGPSGAGKSTIINLILKFYQPDSGEIYLGKHAYSKSNAQFIRGNIALVFQENELFSTTIRENVSYGTQATDEEIISALKKANAYEFVQKLDKGLSTEVGERGIRLSGGQKQRIQIARAVLANSPILILDEATSNLDSRSEKIVQDAMENLMENKLVIIIAHRLSTIQNVDRILVIDDGKIVDEGDPKQLANKEGIYSDLLQYQIEGNKKLLKNYEIY